MERNPRIHPYIDHHGKATATARRRPRAREPHGTADTWQAHRRPGAARSSRGATRLPFAGRFQQPVLGGPQHRGVLAEQRGTGANTGHAALCADTPSQSAPDHSAAAPAGRGCPDHSFGPGNRAVPGPAGPGTALARPGATRRGPARQTTTGAGARWVSRCRRLRRTGSGPSGSGASAGRRCGRRLGSAAGRWPGRRPGRRAPCGRRRRRRGPGLPRSAAPTPRRLRR